MPQILTPRLKLRPIQISDLDVYARLLGDFTVTRLIGGPKTREFMAEKIVKDAATWAQYGYGRFIIELRSQPEAIGMCGVWKSSIDELHFDEIGYAIFPPVWSQGYTTEALAATVDFAHNTANLSQLTALVSPENVSSKKVLLKNGFSFERHINRLHFTNLELWQKTKA
jgi:RimJ/RimL family protein N-acetyltransferase